jgi:hypothetical protein
MLNPFRRDPPRHRRQQPGLGTYSIAAGNAASHIYEMTRRRIWLTTRALPVSERSVCSHTLKTRMPSARSRAATLRARLLLPAILETQYLRFAFGSLRHWEHPCQKQPSTKIATRCVGNQKSGCPGMEPGCISHPLISALTRTSLNRFSVERLPFDRTLDIRTLRSNFVSVSIGNGGEIL